MLPYDDAGIRDEHPMKEKCQTLHKEYKTFLKQLVKESEHTNVTTELIDSKGIEAKEEVTDEIKEPRIQDRDEAIPPWLLGDQSSEVETQKDPADETEDEPTMDVKHTRPHVESAAATPADYEARHWDLQGPADIGKDAADPEVLHQLDADDGGFTEGNSSLEPTQQEPEEKDEPPPGLSLKRKPESEVPIDTHPSAEKKLRNALHIVTPTPTGTNMGAVIERLTGQCYLAERVLNGDGYLLYLCHYDPSGPCEPAYLDGSGHLIRSPGKPRDPGSTLAFGIPTNYDVICPFVYTLVRYKLPPELLDQVAYLLVE